MTKLDYLSRVKTILVSSQDYACAAVIRDLERGMKNEVLDKEYMDYVFSIIVYHSWSGNRENARKQVFAYNREVLLNDILSN